MNYRRNWYRKKYLQSEHWKTLRIEKLAKCHCRCCICGRISQSNDVHHVNYRNLYNVKPEDLRILCRICHEIVHAILEKYPNIRLFETSSQWEEIKQHIQYRTFQAIRRRKQERQRRRKKESKFRLFYRSKRFLQSIGLVTKSSMPWSDNLQFHTGVFSKLRSPFDLIIFYESVVGKSPLGKRAMEGEH